MNILQKYRVKTARYRNRFQDQSVYGANSPQDLEIVGIPNSSLITFKCDGTSRTIDWNEGLTSSNFGTIEQFEAILYQLHLVGFYPYAINCGELRYEEVIRICAAGKNPGFEFYEEPLIVNTNETFSSGTFVGSQYTVVGVDEGSDDGWSEHYFEQTKPKKPRKKKKAKIKVEDVIMERKLKF